MARRTPPHTTSDGEATPGRASHPSEVAAVIPVEPPRAGAPPPARPQDDRSVGDLLGELLRETETLLKQEVALAKTEIRQEVRTASRNVGYLAAGGAVAYSGLIVLLVGLGWLLGQAFDEDLIWLGLLLIGAVVALAGYALVQKGLKTLQHLDPTLERTVDSLNQDKQWLKEEIQH